MADVALLPPPPLCLYSAPRDSGGGRRPADAVPASLMVLVHGRVSLGASTLTSSVGIVALLFVSRSESRGLRRRGTAGVAWILSGMQHLRSGASSLCGLRAACFRLLYAVALFDTSRLGMQCTADWLILHVITAILDVAVGTCCGLCRF